MNAPTTWSSIIFTKKYILYKSNKCVDVGQNEGEKDPKLSVT
jgi:hypothetical protein